MTKLVISESASNLLQEKLNKIINQTDFRNLILVIYRYFARSWSGTFCNDVIELIERNKIENNQYFEKWTEVDAGNITIDVFIDKNLKNKIEHDSKRIKINARTWKIFGKTRGSFWLEMAN